MRTVLLYIFFYITLQAAAQTVFCKVKKNIASPNPVNELFSLDSCFNKGYYKDSVLFYKALINIKIGNLQSANKNVKQLIKLSPGFKEVHYLYGLIYFSDKNYGKSITEFNLAIKDDPKNIKAFYNRSVALGLIEEYLSAIEDLSTCIVLNPAYAQAYYSRGYWYEFTGNNIEAIKDYENTIRLDPKNYDAYLGLANVYKNQNENTKACEAISNAVHAGSQIAEDLKADFCR